MAQTWHESSARTTVGRSASRDGQLAGVALFLVGGAFLIGTMLAASIAFMAARTNERARRLFLGSITYLPLLWVLLIADRL